jgi:hypothetical protein|tara:strand:+ start:887 stop:1183 length:297 start_codon:yes stop_codon:yes gene_type:complete
MLELPNDFPHEPPTGYRYESICKNSNVVAIWSVYERGFNYNDHNECRCIWGFYNTKKRQYHAPINHTKIGAVVDIESTTPFSAMQLNFGNPLEQLLFS